MKVRSNAGQLFFEITIITSGNGFESKKVMHDWASEGQGKVYHMVTDNKTKLKPFLY